MTTTMTTTETLKELAAKLATVEGGRVWIAEKASEPHVRVYFGEHYVAVYDRGESYYWTFVAAPGTSMTATRRKSAVYTGRVEAAL